MCLLGLIPRSYFRAQSIVFSVFTSLIPTQGATPFIGISFRTVCFNIPSLKYVYTLVAIDGALSTYVASIWLLAIAMYKQVIYY